MALPSLANKTRAGFTLIELLIVIGIMAVLAAISVPAINKALSSSRSSKCLSNLKQIGIAVLAYPIENNGDLPVDSGANFSAGADTLWFKLITPYIPTRTGTTTGVAVNKVLRCPAEKQPSDSVSGSICQYTAAYSMVSNGSSRSSGPRKLGGILNPTTTFLVVDGVLLASDYSTSSMSAWNAAIKPDLDVAADSSTKNISFRHNNNMNAVYADGHVATVTWTDRKKVITEYTWKGTSP